MSEVTVTISGPVGSGKSAIYFEIMIALKALGIEVVHGDPDAAQTEINMGFGDTHGALEMYQPRVTLFERRIGSTSSVGDTQRMSLTQVQRLGQEYDAGHVTRHCDDCDFSTAATDVVICPECRGTVG